ncbi:hypothetical protein NSQ54_12760 [Alkalihalobacillus sp. FSL W8-0930]
MSKRLLLTFHSFILIFAIGVISAYFISTSSSGRDTLYLILGIGIALSSVFNLIRLSRPQREATSTKK